VFICCECTFLYRFSPKTSGYTLVPFLQVEVFWIVMTCSAVVNTNVSEVHAASIFIRHQNSHRFLCSHSHISTAAKCYQTCGRHSVYQLLFRISMTVPLSFPKVAVTLLTYKFRIRDVSISILDPQTCSLTKISRFSSLPWSK
jgi:hypothetical protein